jgi:hypothetical protein
VLLTVISLSTMKLDSTTKLEPINARVLWVDYRGRRALKIAPLEGHEHGSAPTRISRNCASNRNSRHQGLLPAARGEGSAH